MSTPEARRRAHVSFRKRKDDAGLCLRCPQKRVPDHTLCANCKERTRNYAQRRYYLNWSEEREKARKRQRAWYLHDPEKALAYQRERYRKYPNLFRGYELKQHYGITLAQYEELKERQSGLCALCRKPPMVGKRGRAHSEKRAPHLYVDHNHATGKVRGLLCHWCNSHIIAGIEKSGASMKQIADYLGVPLVA